MAQTRSTRTDRHLLVVGSGVAGLACALAAADAGARVRLLAAGPLHSGSSWWAQGGIAAAVGEDDSVEYHEADTLAVGAALNDREAVDVLVRQGRQEALALLASGVPFERGGGGEPLLGLEAGHQHRRILHAGGGATGALVSEALLQRALHHPGIEALSETAVTGLVVDWRGRVSGVETPKGDYMGRAVVLATGGYAGLWARTTNPVTNRGQGLEMAWRVGATLADLEFVQFHPTALDLPGAPAFLLSEALRGEGALLVNGEGVPVISPLQARDVVARAIFRYRRESGPVYLSMRHLDPDYVRSTFPAIAAALRQWGLDLATDPVPIAPAAHYCMGGVRTDTGGRTDVPGLYIAGEAACTGVQGANRLASNSLLECLVFGRRSALAAISDAPEAQARWDTRPLDVRSESGGSVSHEELDDPALLGIRLERDLGVERNGPDLQTLAADLPLPASTRSVSHNGHADISGVPSLVAALAARSALLRTESRGAHYRSDYPTTDTRWRGRILWRRGAGASFEEIGE